MVTEDRLVKSLARALDFKGGDGNTAKLRLGIGDDAAIIASGNRRDWVVSCDAFLEGVHFLAHTDPPDSVGYKSLVRATSDLAAMGALPRFYFLTLALPDRCTGKWFDRFLKGMGRASRKTKIQIAGGDTTRASKIFISVTVVGEIGAGRAITRSGARPGRSDIRHRPFGKSGPRPRTNSTRMRQQQIHPEIARAAFLSADSTRTRSLARAPSGRFIHDGRFGRPLNRPLALMRRESSGRSRKRRTNPGR